MKIMEKRNKICNSLYHKKWFRIILFVVAVDMLLFGISFAIGLDIISLIPKMHIVLHIIFGSMYVIVSLFIIHYVFDYKKIKKESHFICHHCGHVCGEEDEEE